MKMLGREIRLDIQDQNFAFIWFGVCVFCKWDQYWILRGPCDKLPPQDRELIFKLEEEFSMCKWGGKRTVRQSPENQPPGETQNVNPGKGKHKDRSHQGQDCASLITQAVSHKPSGSDATFTTHSSKNSRLDPVRQVYHRLFPLSLLHKV